MNTQPISPSTGKLASRSRVTVRRKMASLRVCTQRRQFRPGTARQSPGDDSGRAVGAASRPNAHTSKTLDRRNRRCHLNHPANSSWLNSRYLMSRTAASQLAVGSFPQHSRTVERALANTVRVLPSWIYLAMIIIAAAAICVTVNFRGHTQLSAAERQFHQMETEIADFGLAPTRHCKQKLFESQRNLQQSNRRRERVLVWLGPLMLWFRFNLDQLQI